LSHFILLLLMCRNFLEPNRRLALETDSVVSDPDVRDYHVRDYFIRLRQSRTVRISCSVRTSKEESKIGRKQCMQIRFI